MTAVEEQLNAGAQHPGQDAPSSSPTPPGTTAASSHPSRVLVIGAIPGAGASSVAWSITTAAARGGHRVEVIDAASPRRSGLRNLCATLGVAEPVEPGTHLVPATSGQVRVRFIDGPVDTRVDDPACWDTAAHPGAGTRVVDVGVSAEEILTTTPAAAAWLTGFAAITSWVVLVVPAAAASAARCEAVLSGWAQAGWVGIDQVVLTGHQLPLVTGTTPLLGQAVTGAQLMAHEPAIATTGLPAAGTDPQWPSWEHPGQAVLATMTGLPLPVTKHRWRRRGG